MAPPSRFRSPWTAGTLLLVLAMGLAAPLLLVVGQSGWPVVVGSAALMLLVFGGVERLWQSRPLAARKKKADRRGFRVFTGGKGRGNGHAEDTSDDDSPDDPKKPRWLM